ncbi:MAG: dTMP kinase [Lachnospiraceae bacterium]|nr:dTMP kinase [Lachnospiraceae bacterium]
MAVRGKFIAFEGIDGSGKSTQIALLEQRLKEEGIPVYVTREPTDGPYGAMLHTIMTGRLDACEETIAALYVADRMDHIKNKRNGLLAKIEEGITVLTDRYYFSSYAYQGAHISMDWTIMANSICAQALRPDLNLFFDLKPEVSFARISQNRTDFEIYEKLDNLRNTRQKYLEAFERLKDQEKVSFIDADQSTEQIAEDVWTQVKMLFHQ